MYSSCWTFRLLLFHFVCQSVTMFGWRNGNWRAFLLCSQRSVLWHPLLMVRWCNPVCCKLYLCGLHLFRQSGFQIMGLCSNVSFIYFQVRVSRGGTTYRTFTLVQSTLNVFWLRLQNTGLGTTEVRILDKCKSNKHKGCVFKGPWAEEDQGHIIYKKKHV